MEDRPTLRVSGSLIIWFLNDFSHGENRQETEKREGGREESEVKGCLTSGDMGSTFLNYRSLSLLCSLGSGNHSLPLHLQI